MGRQQWERNRSSLPCMNIYDIIITGIKPSQFLRAQAQPYIYISATPTIILTCSLLTSISDLISSHLQHNVNLLLLSRVLHRAKWPWLRSDERGGVSSLWSLLNQSPPSNPLSSLSSYFHLSLSRFYLLLFGWWEMIIEKKNKMKRYRKLCWMNCSS